MNEIVVISGKGGTGKTSLTAAFATLAEKAVLADCDVDAADLHLVLDPEPSQTEEFRSGYVAAVREHACISCGMCASLCRFDAVIENARATVRGKYRIDADLCEGCGVCARFCPEGAIDLHERLCGEWRVSRTASGPLVHARLDVGGENSGKLVSLVRREARELAEARGDSLVLIDGPPGIGCPAIASITGTSLVVAVTEPSLSGLHDLERVLSLTRHFEIPVAVCVNKHDINADLTRRIEETAERAGARPVGRIPWDPAFTRAQMEGRPVTARGESDLTRGIAAIWTKVLDLLPAPEDN